MTMQYPCVSCMKAVKNNQRGLQCTYCLAWMHTTCTGVKNEHYDDVHYEFLNWRCSKCIFQYLPFATSSSKEFNIKSKHFDKCEMQSHMEKNDSDPISRFDQFRGDGFKCTHLNIRSLYRNIDEIRVFLHNN